MDERSSAFAPSTTLARTPLRDRNQSTAPTRPKPAEPTPAAAPTAAVRVVPAVAMATLQAQLAALTPRFDAMMRSPTLTTGRRTASIRRTGAAVAPSPPSPLMRLSRSGLGTPYADGVVLATDDNDTGDVWGTQGRPARARLSMLTQDDSTATLSSFHADWLRACVRSQACPVPARPCSARTHA